MNILNYNTWFIKPTGKIDKPYSGTKNKGMHYGSKKGFHKGCCGSPKSHGGVFTDYPVKVGRDGKPYPNGQKDTGISFWKIPGWRKPK